jgi:O-antigen/teichoic acid export membrane protein
MFLLSKLFTHYNFLLSRKITSDFLHTVIARVVINLCILLRTILLVRLLAPEFYGTFVVLFSWAIIVSSVFDFGLGLGFLDKETKSSYNATKNNFASLLRARIFLFTLLFIILVAVDFMSKNQLWTYVILVLVMGVGHSFFIFFLTFYQTIQNFRKYAWLDLQANLIHSLWMVAGLLAFSYNQFSFTNFLWWFSCGGWIAFIFQLSISEISMKDILSNNLKADFKYFSKLIRFGKWIAFSTISFIAYERYSIILLSYYKNTIDAGYYGLASYIGRAIMLIVISLTTILHPRFSSIDNVASIKYSIKTLNIIVLPLVVSILTVYYTIGHRIFLMIFGNLYSGTLPYFDILIPAFLMLLVSAPFVSITTFYLRKPQLIAWLCFIKIIIFASVSKELFHTYGVLGLAWFQSSSTILEQMIIITYVVFSLRRIHKDENSISCN